MKWIFLGVILTILLIGIIIFRPGSKPAPLPQAIPSSTTMKLSSSAFQDNQAIPAQYTCDGANVSPPLEISDVPSNTQSLALIVDDPDAPARDLPAGEAGWVHWLVWNIDPKITTIAENSVPAGAVQGQTDFGNNQYGGPCPPSGTHHYQFKLYALDTTLDLPSTTTKKQLEAAFTGHTLSQTLLTGLYSR